jgi:hypothetical protein
MTLSHIDPEIGDLIGLSDRLREGTYFLYGIDTNCNLDEIGLGMREV